MGRRELAKTKWIRDLILKDLFFCLFPSYNFAKRVGLDSWKMENPET